MSDWVSATIIDDDDFTNTELNNELKDELKVEEIEIVKKTRKYTKRAPKVEKVDKEKEEKESIVIVCLLKKFYHSETNIIELNNSVKSLTKIITKIYTSEIKAEKK